MITFKEYNELEELDEIEILDEALTPQQRRRRSMIMKRLSKRIAIKRQRSLKKRATKDVLMKRARKMARNKLAAKYLKGKDLSKLSFNDRKRLEDRLKGKRKTIDRIARKLLKKAKAADVARHKSKAEKEKK